MYPSHFAYTEYINTLTHSQSVALTNATVSEKWKFTLKKKKSERERKFY